MAAALIVLMEGRAGREGKYRFPTSFLQDRPFLGHERRDSVSDAFDARRQANLPSTQSNNRQCETRVAKISLILRVTLNG